MVSVDKLREWSRWLDSAYATDDGESYTVYSYQPYDGMKSCGEYMREQCDDIEREIAERYIALPLDADGVPWHIGDITENRNVVNGITFDRHGAHFTSTFNDIDPSIHTHFKPRTLEDVLREFTDEVIEWSGYSGPVSNDTTLSGMSAKYAAEIRELLGGDAE